MQNIFNKLGYSWHYQVLNSKTMEFLKIESDYLL